MSETKCRTFRNEVIAPESGDTFFDCVFVQCQVIAGDEENIVFDSCLFIESSISATGAVPCN